MSDPGKNAIDRIVELFEMSSSLPDDVDVNLPEVQAFVQTLPEYLQNSFKAGTADPDTRKMSQEFNKGLRVYFNKLQAAREEGKKIAFVPFNFGPEILYAMDMVPVCVEVLTSMAQGLEEGVTEYLEGPALRSIGELVIHDFQRYGDVSLNRLAPHLEERGVCETAFSLAFQEEELEEGMAERIVADCIRKIKMNTLKKQMEGLQRRIKEAEAQGDEALLNSLFLSVKALGPQLHKLQKEGLKGPS